MANDSGCAKGTDLQLHGNERWLRALNPEEELESRSGQRNSVGTAGSVDEYIADFPDEVQEILEKIRRTIRRAAPDAEETISYQIPAFTLKGNLIHFAGYKRHIGLYPGSRTIKKFKKDLSAYEQSKGTVRFSLDKPIPFALISKIVKSRVKENLQKPAAKGKKGSK